jgi:iron(III) transport system substrate-binding protein
MLAVLSACGGQPATEAPTAAATDAPAAPTEAPAATDAPAATEAPAPTEAPAATEAATIAPEPTAAPPEASASGEVTVYTSRSEALFAPVVEAFNRQYPDIKVNVLSGSNGDLLAKIKEEAANPQADVFINSDTVSIAANSDVFQPNDSEAVQQVPVQFRADDDTWTALTLRGRVLMYNTDLVQPADLPQSIFDLTDPKWKGQFASTDSSGGAMMGHMVALRELVGEERLSEFIQGLVANETQWLGSSHTNVRNAVGNGEAQIGLVNHYYYYLSQAEGQPVGIHYFDDDFGLIVNSTNAGIIEGAKNLENAKLFVDFMLSEAGQQVFAEKNFEYPIMPGVPLAEGVEPLGDRPIAEIALKTLGDQLEPTRALVQAAGLP